MPVVTIGENTTDDFTGTTTDTYLREDAAAINQDSGSLEVSKATAGQHRTTVIYFDIAGSIPAGSTINSAAINLFLENWNSAGVTMDCYALLVAFTEGGATWNTRDGTNNWNTGGAQGSGTDHGATLLAQTAVTNTLAYKVFSGANLTAFIQDVVDSVVSNLGFVFIRNGTGNDGEYHSFGSSEAATDGRRPYIEIDYTEAAGVAVGTKIYIEYNRAVNG